MECRELLYGMRFSLKPKGAVHKSYFFASLESCHYGRQRLNFQR